MNAKDRSIRKICIAAIKQHAFKPINYPLTKLFESEEFSFLTYNKSLSLPHNENELPITLTYVDSKNWTLITTQRIITSIKNEIKEIFATSIISWKWNDFKGYKDSPITYGQLILDNDCSFDIIIETGNASMISVYAIMTLADLKSNEQIIKTLSRYEKRGFIKPD